MGFHFARRNRRTDDQHQCDFSGPVLAGAFWTFRFILMRLNMPPPPAGDARAARCIDIDSDLAVAGDLTLQEVVDVVSQVRDRRGRIAVAKLPSVPRQILKDIPTAAKLGEPRRLKI